MRTKDQNSIVHVVHCIDTEGPLYEPVSETFTRIENIFGVKLKPTKSNLIKLQNKKIKLQGKEDAIQKLVDPNLLNYMSDWDRLGSMLDDAMSKEFRNQSVDSFGNGWIYNWFCLACVEMNENPRSRPEGYHEVFDFYQQRISNKVSNRDRLFFHFHPQSFYKEAQHCATHWWANGNTLYQILSRRVIDRLWFPSCNRPGFHVNRPDSHWFLEQFIPFDFANQAVENNKLDKQQLDLAGGRFGDWRRAPVSWKPYHPSYDDYQVEGNCRRWIARCLNVGTRLRVLSEKDVSLAFKEALQGKPAVLAFTNHDFRDIRYDIKNVSQLLDSVKQYYPSVNYKFSNALDAMRSALKLPKNRACKFELKIESTGKRHLMKISSENPTFGPQPFLALKSLSGGYFHDNFDIQVPYHSWSYTFDEQTIALDKLSDIGIATNNSVGETTILKWKPSEDSTEEKFLNLYN